MGFLWWQTYLPVFNTLLIMISGLFLLAGYYFIKRRQIQRHRTSMIVATVFAGLFLVVYVIRWFILGSKPFGGDGLAYVAYLVVLITHIILAIAVGPLALLTLFRGLRSEFRQHRAIARITFPLWLYVVASGWVVYWMLHHMY